MHINTLIIWHFNILSGLANIRESASISSPLFVRCSPTKVEILMRAPEQESWRVLRENCCWNDLVGLQGAAKLLIVFRVVKGYLCVLWTISPGLCRR